MQMTNCHGVVYRQSDTATHTKTGIDIAIYQKAVRVRVIMLNGLLETLHIRKPRPYVHGYYQELRELEQKQDLQEVAKSLGLKNFPEPKPKVEEVKIWSKDNCDDPYCVNNHNRRALGGMIMGIAAYERASGHFAQTVVYNPRPPVGVS